MTDEQTQMIQDCEEREARLSDWERGFIDSLSRQQRDLTDRQIETLGRIWEKATEKG